MRRIQHRAVRSKKQESDRDTLKQGSIEKGQKEQNGNLSHNMLANKNVCVLK